MAYCSLMGTHALKEFSSTLQLDQERIEKKELKKQLKVVQRAKDTLLMDMRNTNHQLQVELAEAQVLITSGVPEAQ